MSYQVNKSLYINTVRTNKTTQTCSNNHRTILSRRAVHILIALFIQAPIYTEETHEVIFFFFSKINLETQKENSAIIDQNSF